MGITFGQRLGGHVSLSGGGETPRLAAPDGARVKVIQFGSMGRLIGPVFLIYQRRGLRARSCGRACQSSLSRCRPVVEGVIAMNRNLLNSFFSDERGTETVEWGLMAGLIVGGLVVTVGLIGLWVKNKFAALQLDLGA